MDIGAFANIESLNEIMSANNIVVPRLRGLRLMKVEHPVPKEFIEEQIEYIALVECEQACCSNFSYDAGWSEYSSRTRKLMKKYLKFAENGDTAGIRWDKVHGQKRKLFKRIFRNARKRVLNNYSVFNKYCGREDILYIHARIGGGNWPYYCHEVKNQPWFIERIDDPFDSTYCDIYAKIDAPSIKEDE